MTDHGPAPWQEAEVSPRKYRIVVKDGDGVVVAHVIWSGCKDPQWRANAALIVSAPAILTELQGLAEDLHSFVDSGTAPNREWIAENLASIRGEIANAEGKTA